MDTAANTPKKPPENPLQTTGSALMFEEFDSFFNDFLYRRWPRLLNWNSPGVALAEDFIKVDIIDHDHEIEVRAALPGIKKEDLEVSINDQAITIRTSFAGEKKEDGKYFRREITRGSYQRTLSLPNNVDNANAKAVFADGMLKVTVPKTEKIPRKHITID
ncbi:Hsp20/alpha crystallin family protein [Methylovulum psychrotolerans]|uniref:Heat-shock protein Hsp20 n=1 Tax=Methylovulum psychrotolerans TaxID=1704499 RepID=A0A2S5CGA9_9GAMM|nr:Hsp20/alpha crystallin family protein [Methylovulum psychrotolerans]POZ49841.1 heat-shock protein Hsp20 [Methylovulum psychrotolerans]